MSFHSKADYKGHYDHNGIPQLNYQGSIGIQYNPIAIAQWGLGNYNLWLNTKSKKNYNKFIKCSDWLVENLELNKKGLKVWMHHFDFEYRDKLTSPWYSGLAQGQGISVLIRALKETGDKKYAIAIDEAYKSILVDVEAGRVNYTDLNGENWIEEYIVKPPTHILNGFLWTLWGVYEYSVYFKDSKSKILFDNFSDTILNNLDSYDLGYWSKYEISNTKIPMIASLFYHKLHIIQLEIMFLITGDKNYRKYSIKWKKYSENKLFKIIAISHKIIFKVLYY